VSGIASRSKAGGVSYETPARLSRFKRRAISCNGNEPSIHSIFIAFFQCTVVRLDTRKFLLATRVALTLRAIVRRLIIASDEGR
jgi:hypothetical protein